MRQVLCQLNYSPVFLWDAGDRIQGSVYVRQVLYQLSQGPRSLCSSACAPCVLCPLSSLQTPWDSLKPGSPWLDNEKLHAPAAKYSPAPFTKTWLQPYWLSHADDPTGKLVPGPTSRVWCPALPPTPCPGDLDATSCKSSSPGMRLSFHFLPFPVPGKYLQRGPRTLQGRLV